MQISKNINNIEWIIEEVQRIVPRDRVLTGEPLSGYTSFRIGGPARALVIVHNEKELSRVLRLLRDSQTRHFLIGNGSNLLIKDGGYNGIIIKLGGEFEELSCEGELIEAGAACLLSRVSSAAAENSLAGMEFASGIPGTLGGAVFMNAGAYGGEMKDIVESVRVMSPDGFSTIDVSGDDMEFSYRHSILEENGYIVLKARLRLRTGDREEIRERIRELTCKRNEKQPVNFPSAGSTFKRPVGGFAAALIDEAGLKGTSVGGAEVSVKHSGFVINKGGATASDVIELMELVSDKVFERSGIRLEPEVRIIGEDETWQR